MEFTTFYMWINIIMAAFFAVVGIAINNAFIPCYLGVGAFAFMAATTYAIKKNIIS